VPAFIDHAGNWAFMGELMPTGDQMRRAPAHAGRLPPWERLAIALVLLVVAALTIVIMMSAGPSQHSATPNVPPRAGKTPAVAPAVEGGGSASGATGLPAPTARENQRLAAALAPVMQPRGGSLAVGIVEDRTAAIYDGSHLFHTAGIVRADILAALLLEHQRAGTAMSEQQRELAAKMIENGDGGATAALWNAVGQASGLSGANRLLYLRHTAPGDLWQLTSTTVDDQLRLLADLTWPGSPLSAAARPYELGLMRHVSAGQRWGITAAAPGTPPAVTNGWLTDGGGTTWLINSIGVIFRAGHQVLVAVFSDGQPSESAGMNQVAAAVKAAVSAISGGSATAAGAPGAHAARGSGGI
jgi:hypothetical protein